MQKPVLMGPPAHGKPELKASLIDSVGDGDRQWRWIVLYWGRWCGRGSRSRSTGRARDGICETVQQNRHPLAEEASQPCKAGDGAHRHVTAAQVEVELGPRHGLLDAATPGGAQVSEAGVSMESVRRTAATTTTNMTDGPTQHAAHALPSLHSQAVAQQRRRVYWPPAPTAGVRDLAHIAVECIANRNAAPGGSAARTWAVWPETLFTQRREVRWARAKGSPLSPPSSSKYSERQWHSMARVHGTGRREPLPAGSNFLAREQARTGTVRVRVLSGAAAAGRKETTRHNQ
jgi:hypothetical protein